jgi:hypothetical protein
VSDFVGALYINITRRRPRVLSHDRKDCMEEI